MKKPEKLTFAINIMESAWLLYFAGLSLFHGEEYIYWPAVVSNLVPSPTFFCENTETLACLSFSRPPPDPATHSPLPLPPTPTTTTTTPPLKYQSWCSQGCLQMSSFSFCMRSSELSPRPPHPFPFRSLCKVYITMVLFLYNTL